MAIRPGTSPTRCDPARQQIDLVFDNNRLASSLYGEFDQNLALLERRLGVDARARGNMVTLAGPPRLWRWRGACSNRSTIGCSKATT